MQVPSTEAGQGDQGVPVEMEKTSGGTYESKRFENVLAVERITRE